MKRFHISIAVENFEASVTDYTHRLGAGPCVVSEGRYAMWKTDLLNFTISCKEGQISGRVRHIGFEDDSLHGFREETDSNGMVWEYFSPDAQQKEIGKKFPEAVKK